MKQLNLATYTQSIWERRALSMLLREHTLERFLAEPTSDTLTAYRSAIAEHEKERALYDVLTMPVGKGRIAPLERGQA